MANHSSCVCTLFTQATLCVALFFAFYIGTPQISNKPSSLELYFLSVTGGNRPPMHQFHLLKQMEKLAKVYKVKFVVNISEFGEEDPLFNNVTFDFPSLKIPWYTTGTSQGQRMGYFLKQIAIPHEQILDIVGMDTRLLQTRDRGNDQLEWLTRTLAMTESNWRIVVGYQPLLICEKQHATKTKLYEHLSHVLSNYGVNAYLSKQGSDGHYIHDRGIAHIGNPVYVDEKQVDPSMNGSSSCIRGMHDGFLLHRVSPLEIVSYFFNPASEMVFKSRLQQRGKEAM